MKKARWIPVLVVMALALGGCDALERQATGTVSDVQTEDGQVTGFSVEGADFSVGETTACFFNLDEPPGEAFLAGEAEVTVRYGLLQWPFGRKEADSVWVDGYRSGEEALSDGTALEVWTETFDVSYRLPDGTVLLREDTFSELDDVYTSGEDVSDLNERAQETILAWYEEQGCLYDIEAELEAAYSDFRAAGDPEEFDSRLVSQQAGPTASGERVIYIVTDVTRRGDGLVSWQYRYSAAFDRETGEHLDFSELFTCPPEEAMGLILDAAELDTADRQEIEAVIRPEDMVVHDDHVEFSFPPGTLSSVDPDSGYMFAVDMEKLEGVLQDWAVPVPYSQNA